MVVIDIIDIPDICKQLTIEGSLIKPIKSRIFSALWL